MDYLNKFIIGVWNIGIIENAIDSILTKNNDIAVRWMKHEYKDRFFADPFLYDQDTNNYYFISEEFSFWENMGYISLLTVNRFTMELIRKEKLISSKYHLSYPFPYKKYIIPECYRSNRCDGYLIEDKKIKNTKQIAPFGLIDQTFLEYNGYEWIFATDKDNPLAGLKIFYREIGTKDWIPHKKNPVKEDIRTARPGGHFFKVGETLYRPAQDSEKLYGHQINIMRVDLLTTEDYQETKVKTINSLNSPPYSMGFHTFNVENGFIVVDGYREYHSFVVKPLTVLKSKLLG